jgi:hypothetical protein
LDRAEDEHQHEVVDGRCRRGGSAGHTCSLYAEKPIIPAYW